MAKIKINKLPAGFKLIDGKIVQEEMPNMQMGGFVTGDQMNFGLVTTPSNVTGEQMSDSNDPDVRYSLAPVPRDKANIEAEKGETVLTDLNGDGNYGLYNIGGERHSNGGSPLYLSDQSFVFSDTRDMKFDKSQMAEFGVESRKKKTPAQISKKYELNKFYGAIDDEYADEIQVKSAELMLDKNKMDLSKLAYAQELKKDFVDGVPLAAHPYLLSIGEDPIEFTAKVEEISQQKAMMKAISALPPEEQAKMLMLQQLLEQAQAQPVDPQQTPMTPSADPMRDPAMDPAMLAAMDDPMRDPMMREPLAMPMNLAPELPPVESKLDQAQDGTEIRLGTTEGDKWYMSSAGQAYRNKIYDNYKRRWESDEVQKELKRRGLSTTLMKPQEFHTNFLANQDQIYSINEAYKDEADFLKQDDWDSSIMVNGKRVPMGRYAEALDRVNELRKDQGLEPFEKLTRDQIAAFESGYAGNILARAFEANPDAKKKFETTGVIDQGVIDPLTGEEIAITPETGWAGNTWVGEGITIDTSQYEPEKVEEVVEEGEDLVVPELGRERFAPTPEFWKQDLVRMAEIAGRNRDFDLPFQQELQRQDIDYVLEDPTRAIAAINEQANIANQANMAFSGPQAGSARNLSMAGKALKSVADATAGVQARNVQTANRADYQQAVLDQRTDVRNAAANVKEYDDTVKVLENYRNEKMLDRKQFADAYMDALTNRANTFNLNTMQDYYQIDPLTGGMIGQVSSRAFDPVKPPADRLDQYINTAQRLEKAGVTPTGEILASIMGDAASQDPYQTNIQREMMRQNPYLQYNRRMEKGGEKKLKKYAVPFYIGKTGM